MQKKQGTVYYCFTNINSSSKHGRMVNIQIDTQLL